MSSITIKAHKVAKGKAQGEALVSKTPIAFLGGINPRNGVVVEKGHELEGKSIADKVLVYPVGKGSTAGAYQLYEHTINGKAPRAIVNLRADPVTAIGAIISNIPMVDNPEKNPIEIIRTGDMVEVDADRGTIKITSK